MNCSKCGTQGSSKCRNVFPSDTQLRSVMTIRFEGEEVTVKYDQYGSDNRKEHLRSMISAIEAVLASEKLAALVDFPARL